MSYDMISMVDLARPRKRTKRLETFTVPSRFAPLPCLQCRAARHAVSSLLLLLLLFYFAHKTI